MKMLTRKCSLFTAAGAVVLTLASIPAGAEDLAQNLGPVGPNEPILTTVGSKRVIAFYVPGSGNCGTNMVVWDRTDEAGDSAARVRISLSPRQMVHIDSANNESLNLRCGDNAEKLAIVDPNAFVAAGSTR
jgi:hypothetical protein